MENWTADWSMDRINLELEGIKLVGVSAPSFADVDSTPVSLSYQGIFTQAYYYMHLHNIFLQISHPQ